MIDALHAAVARILDMPRVSFSTEASADAHRWLDKKHADGKVHEPGTVAAMLAISEKRNLRQIYDVGALYGYFTLVAQQLVSDVRIVAMEMHPSAKDALYVNVNDGKHREVECLHMVATNVCRPQVKFWISGFNIYEEPAGGWDELSNVPGAMKPRGDNNRGRGWACVDFATIDAVTVLSGLKPDLIKIDVEGFQGKAVEGMVETLKAYRPHVVIELHDPEKISRFGITNKSTVEPFRQLGYAAFWCTNFRDKDARFDVVTEMNEAHERLGIMLLCP